VNFSDLQSADAIWWWTAVFNFGVLPVLYSIGMYFLAPRLNANRPLWVVLALIPYVNWIFEVYVMFKVLFRILDNLAEIKAMLARRAALPGAEGEIR